MSQCVDFPFALVLSLRKLKTALTYLLAFESEHALKNIKLYRTSNNFGQLSTKKLWYTFTVHQECIFWFRRSCMALLNSYTIRFDFWSQKIKSRNFLNKESCYFHVSLQLAFIMNLLYIFKQSPLYYILNLVQTHIYAAHVCGFCRCDSQA